MAMAIEFENVGNILDGFIRALGDEDPIGTYCPLFWISSMLLGRNIVAWPSHGVRWSAFAAQMETYAAKCDIPVVEFRALKNSADLAGETVGFIEDMIVRQADLSRNVATGLKYMVDECTDNILEHSQSEFGYISSHVDKVNHFADICIADKGITVLGSYLANNDTDITTDLEALQAANRGISTKNRPNAENRGYGLTTTKKMIVSGLGGSFAMISGGAVFIQDANGRRFLDSADSLKIQGTIIMLRFPYINSEFRYINYIE